MPVNPFTNPLAPIASGVPNPFLTSKNPFSSNQLTFAAHLIQGTGLSGAVVMGWIAAEEPVGANTGFGGTQNWLNIGITGAGARGSGNSIWSDPAKAGDASASWLKGTLSVPGFGSASAGIQGILRTVGQPDSVQISAIQRSGWATSGYPTLPALVSQYGKFAPAGSYIAPGGTANAGGTGTLPNDALTSGFRVGDPTNPDEDYWTAMNRIAQERYWYLFSDGETLYLADGPDLMKQDVALSVDRIADIGNINNLELTFDNTAWTYTATHRKRKRVQRRSALAKVTSPVEAQLHYVCAIDAARAGDVVELANTGPGDGKWLVGDCRRSVFEVTSEISLVVALTPLTETALNPAGVNPLNNTAQYGPGVGVGNVKGYVNPVGNWSPTRIDAGVDGTLSGNYLAPGDSRILVADASNAGWQGGGYIAGQFTSGPLSGKVWYVAEGVVPTVSIHAVVKAGTPVARPANNPYNQITGNIETGWAVPTIPSLPLGFHGNKDDQGPIALAAGNSFNRFLVKLGAKPGTVQKRGIGVVPAAMPGGYP